VIRDLFGHVPRYRFDLFHLRAGFERVAPEAEPLVAPSRCQLDALGPGAGTLGPELVQFYFGEQVFPVGLIAVLAGGFHSIATILGATAAARDDEQQTDSN
jgi:hypothetical protein